MAPFVTYLLLLKLLMKEGGKALVDYAIVPSRTPHAVSTAHVSTDVFTFHLSISHQRVLHKDHMKEIQSLMTKSLNQNLLN